VGEDTDDRPIEWDYGDRDLPTPEEEEFARSLVALDRTCGFYLYKDTDGTPWMLISSHVHTSPRSGGATLRVDSDSAAFGAGGARAD